MKHDTKLNVLSHPICAMWVFYHLTGPILSLSNLYVLRSCEFRFLIFLKTCLRVSELFSFAFLFFFSPTCKTRLSFQAFPHDRPKIHYYFFEKEEICNWYPYRNSSFEKTDLRSTVKPQGLTNLQETETAARHISPLWVIYSRTEIMYL